MSFAQRLNSERGQRVMRTAAAAPWAFTALVDGKDLVVPHGIATCFGGEADPEDDGNTASGFNTKAHPKAAAVALPMRGEMFKGLSPAEHAALDGSPIPRVEWLTIVEVALLPTDLVNQSWDVIESAGLIWEAFPVIDLGPGRRTGNALDLTPGAARVFNAQASATNFMMRCCYRIKGGAVALPPFGLEVGFVEK